jgi:hypothetical protein
MKILGINFTKINAEKTSSKIKDVKVNTNIDISKISEVKSNFLNSDEKILGINFTNIINYDPNFAKIELKGNILISVDSDLFEKVLKQWKDKKIPEDFRVTLFNLILKKSSLKALQLEEELNIPFHIPLPSIKNPENKK